MSDQVVRQYLVTAGGPAGVELAEFTLRPDLCAPEMSAEKLMMIDFAEEWTHLGDLGVAVMPTTGLHAHSARKGWSWTTDEITDGIAATEEDIADLGEAPIAAYALGHITEGGDREQAVVVAGLRAPATAPSSGWETCLKGAWVHRCSSAPASAATVSSWSASAWRCPPAVNTVLPPLIASAPL